MTEIAENLQQIRGNIAKFEQEFNRNKGSVQLLAASKNQAVDKIVEAINAGQTIFGENYLQQALPKIAAVNEKVPDKAIEWHFIGPIQSNKTRKIAEHFTWVQSVANQKIADRLNEQRPAHLAPLNICIEINVDAEDSKAGTTFSNAHALMAHCSRLPRLKVRGLMAIPKIQTEFNAQREEFHRLFLLWRDLRDEGFELDTLSMGMTEDYKAAIAEGATMVRIGTGIFGARD